MRVDVLTVRGAESKEHATAALIRFVEIIGLIEHMLAESKARFDQVGAQKIGRSTGRPTGCFNERVFDLAQVWLISPDRQAMLQRAFQSWTFPSWQFLWCLPGKMPVVGAKRSGRQNAHCRRGGGSKRVASKRENAYDLRHRGSRLDRGGLT
jgi:hypothetical protein